MILFCSKVLCFHGVNTPTAEGGDVLSQWTDTSKMSAVYNCLGFSATQMVC